MKDRRGVRWLGMVFVVLSCLMPTGAQGQPSDFLTAATTTSAGDRAQETGVAPAIQESTTTTPTTNSVTKAATAGSASAAMKGGTTTTTLSPTASDTDDVVHLPTVPTAVPRVEQSSPTPDQDTSAATAAVTGTAAAGPAILPLESPVDGTRTAAVASPSSIVIADSDQVALPEDAGEPVRLSAVRSHAQVLARSMLLLALLLLVAPSVIEARRRKRR